MALRGHGHVTYFDRGSKVVYFNFEEVEHCPMSDNDLASDHLLLDLVFASTFLMSRFWVWVT